jgi:hypothetical protein
MRTINWRGWMWQYFLPVLLLGGSWGLGFLIMGDPDVLWVFVVAPMLSVVAGYAFRPANVWVMPGIVGAGVIAGFFIADALGKIEGFRPYGAVMFGLVIVVPLLTFNNWLGKAMRVGTFQTWRNDWRDVEPHGPAG